MIEVKNNYEKRFNSFFIMIIFFTLIEIPYFFLLSGVFLSAFIMIKSFFKNVPFSINIPLFVLLGFSISFFLFYTQAESTIIFRIFSYLSLVLYYFIGYNYNHFLKGINISSINEKTHKDLVKIIAFSFFLYVVIMLSISLITKNFYNGRNPINLWVEGYRPATHLGTMLVFSLTLFIADLFIESTSQINKIVSFLLIIVIFFINIVTVSRFIILLTPILFIIAIISKNIFYRSNKLSWSIYILFALILVTLFEVNIFGLKTYVYSTPLGSRLFNSFSSETMDARFSRIGYVLENFSLSYIGGGYFESKVGLLHDVFFNVYDYGGIIPFFFILIFFIIAIIDYFRFILRKCVSNNSKLLITLVYSGIAIQLLIEPILHSVPTFFWMFCMLSGIIKRDLQVNKIENELRVISIV